MHTWQRIRKSIIGLSHFSLYFFFFRILFILFDSACLLSASTPNSLSLTTPHNPVEECTVATTTWTLPWAIIAWTQCLDRWAPWPLWIQNRCFIQAYIVTPNSFYVVFSTHAEVVIVVVRYEFAGQWKQPYPGTDNRDWHADSRGWIQFCK